MLNFTKSNALKQNFITLIAAVLLLLSFGAKAQTIVEYNVPTSGSQPGSITAGPDGNLWFAEFNGNNIGEVTTSGSIIEYTIPATGSQSVGITAGTDGNLWFTESSTTANKIGKVTTNGVFTQYTVPTASSQPWGITAGPDGNIWFTEYNGRKIGKITTSGSKTEYTVPTINSFPPSITAGPDGNLWFTENGSNKIGKVTTSGVFTEYTVPTTGSGPWGITTGSDGNLWFAEELGNKIGKVTTSGVFTEYTVPTASSKPYQISKGPDGNLWFTEYTGNKIGKITTSGSITEYSIPTASSRSEGITAGPDGNIWFVESSGNKIGVLYLRSYMETPAIGTGSDTGSISPNMTQTVNGGLATNFTLTPIPPYTNISVSGDCGGTLDGNIFTTYPITHNCTVVANFYRLNTAPVITSSNSTTFVAGQSANFTVMDTGYPAPTLTETGTLPPGLQFNASTGVISGATNTTGTYNLTLTAINSAGTTRQNFTLTVLKTLQSISITSPVTNPAPNQKIALTVTGTYSDGSTEDITRLISQISINNAESAVPIPPLPNDATLNVYTRNPGSAIVTVTLGNLTGSLTINVVATAPYLQNIRLTSPSTNLMSCQHANLTATGIYSDGSTQDLTSNVTWKTTNGTVGVINPMTGEAMGRAPGSFIAYAYGPTTFSRMGTLTLNVTAPTFKKGAKGKITSQIKGQSTATTPADMCLPTTLGMPIITELTPNAGPLLDAEHSPLVTIHGTDFMPDATVQMGTANPIQCQPNNSATACTYINNETLQLQMPVMNTTGPVEITITNPDDTASVPIEEGANVYTVASLTGIKTFVEEESAIAFKEPSSARGSSPVTGEGINTNGPTLGGTGVALSGIFPQKGTAIEVDFDNVAGEIATVDSMNRITVNTPAHVAGAVDASLYEKNSDGSKTFLGSLPHAYQYRPQRCTLGNGTFGSIDQCVTELKACVYVPTAPSVTKHIEVTSHLVTNPTLAGGMPQCVDAMPKFDVITVNATDTYPKILCTTANAPLVANRTSTPSAACASLASNAAGKIPNLTMIDLSYRDATGVSSIEEHALVVPLTWEDRVSLIAPSNESYKGAASMQLAKNGYSPQTSSSGFCLLTNLPTHLPIPVANQNYCLNASLYTLPNEPLGSSPWTLQTIADKGSFMVVDAGSQLV